MCGELVVSFLVFLVHWGVFYRVIDTVVIRLCANGAAILMLGQKTSGMYPQILATHADIHVIYIS